MPAETATRGAITPTSVPSVKCSLRCAAREQRGERCQAKQFERCGTTSARTHTRAPQHKKTKAQHTAHNKMPRNAAMTLRQPHHTQQLDTGALLGQRSSSGRPGTLLDSNQCGSSQRSTDVNRHYSASFGKEYKHENPRRFDPYRAIHTQQLRSRWTTQFHPRRQQTIRKITEEEQRYES